MLRFCVCSVRTSYEKNRKFRWRQELMRRVDRGPWPKDSSGQRKAFHPYTKAKGDLFVRMGEYCSYCERAKCTLEVEHVVPRKWDCTLKEDWTNFLLACRNCNGIKGCRNQSRIGYTWPDDDEDWLPFDYFPEGIVKVRSSLSGERRDKAQKLFDLVDIGRKPSCDPQARDLRWRHRREAWGVAVRTLEGLSSAKDVEYVIELAKAHGFWSVWMTVFKDCPHVLNRLREAFPGTR